MNVKIMKISLFLAISAFVCTTWAGQVEQGIEAYEKSDYQTALKKFSNAAKNDTVVAQYFLGEMYIDGSGVERNVEKAMFWYELAAKQGYAKAQYRLGFIFRSYDEYGGKSKENKLAVYWYEKAAKQGDDYAQWHLALLHHTVPEVEDYKKALYWYTKSAEQANIWAQRNLGDLYESGDGVLQDYVTAHMWYNIAYANGNPLARISRDRVAEKMTPAQTERAQKLASQCLTQKFKNCSKLK